MSNLRQKAELKIWLKWRLPPFNVIRPTAHWLSAVGVSGLGGGHGQPLSSLPTVTLVSETEFKFHIELEQEGKGISLLVDNALEIWKPCTLDLTDVDNWLIINNGTLLYMSEKWSTARGPVVTLRSPWWNASGVL